MATTDPIGTVDPRFGEEGAGPTPWSDVRAALTEAELFWLSTVRVDGRPHVTPLIAVLVDDTMHFCTGVTEQKAKNLNRLTGRCTMTTGTNTWARGLDIVLDVRWSESPTRSGCSRSPTCTKRSTAATGISR